MGLTIGLVEYTLRLDVISKHFIGSNIEKYSNAVSHLFGFIDKM